MNDAKLSSSDLSKSVKIDFSSADFYEPVDLSLRCQFILLKLFTNLTY